MGLFLSCLSGAWLENNMLLLYSLPKPLPSCPPALLRSKSSTVRSACSINHSDPYDLAGQVRPDSQNDYWRIAPAARTAKKTTVSDQEQVTAGDLGAVFVILSPDGSSQGPFSNMSQVKSTNILPPLPSFPKEVLDMKFPFVKVEDLAWASSGRTSTFFLPRFPSIYIYMLTYLCTSHSLG